jgi:hypothetical protein
MHDSEDGTSVWSREHAAGSQMVRHLEPLRGKRHLDGASVSFEADLREERRPLVGASLQGGYDDRRFEAERRFSLTRENRPRF